MKITYKKFINTYEPISVEWNFNGREVLLEFTESITAIFSEKINRVVVELFSENKISFYELSGELDLSGTLPNMENYQYRGINKSIQSKTGISFLFHPTDESVGNEWRDTEQYELDLKAPNFLGKKLGIYR